MFRRVLTASARQASQSSRRYVSSYRHQRSTANLAYYAAGATVLTAGYLGLSLTQEHGRVYNDSEAPSPSSKATPKKRTAKVKEEPPVSEFVADTPTPVSNNTLPAADDSSEPKSPSDDGKDITIASVESKGDSDENEDEGGAGAVAGGGGGAYNPETGEINWDCPCLGGMAHGPCGPEFREAFSCFIFSEVEPKGMDCVEKFKGMQSCFREHPEIYGDEIMRDDDDEEEAPLVGGQGETAIPVASEDLAEPTPSASAEAPSPAPKPKAKQQQRPTKGEATTQVSLEETSTPTPTSLDTPAPAPKP